MSSPAPSTFSELLELRAELRPEARAYTFLVDGETEETWLSHAQLRQRARAIGGLLQEAGARGERVLLLFPPGLDYVAAFLGCLHAGATAVPAYPPDPLRLSRTLPRLEALVADARARFVLTQAGLRDMAESFFEQAPSLAAPRWLPVEEATDAHAAAWRPPSATRDTVALLQYTSGSTGSPRGVMLTHGNLLHNSAAIQRCFEHDERSVGVIWLPPYHDMGLIGGILQPLYAGFPVVLLSPLDFLARPLRWLQAISRYRATTSGGPNFAYELCVRKVSPEERAALDLSSWTLAFNGAEPIHARALTRFRETFAPAGFRAEAMYPCYGLAEATLLASGGRKSQPPVLRSFLRARLERNEAIASPEPAEGTQTLVGCGERIPGQELLIVDPGSRHPVAEGRVGEIWLRGPSISQGYWNRPEKTEATFRAVRADTSEAGYLRTGDLGFLRDGELFVTGRIKDLIIIRGRNHYPQDLERTAVASHPALRPGCLAAFPVEREGEEHLVLIQEVDTRRELDARAIIEAVRGAVAGEHGVHLHAVTLVAPGSIPKTSSGKVQRRACKAAWLAGQLQVVSSDVTGGTPAPAPEVLRAEELRAEELRLLPRERREEVLASWLLGRVSSTLHVPVARIERSAPLVQLGLDSLHLVGLRTELEGTLGVEVPLAAMMEGLGIDGLLQRCLEGLARGVEASSGPRPVPREGTLPLSYPQEEMWLASRLERGTGSYNIPVVLRLRGALRADWLALCFQELVRRHEALRTCFPETGGVPAQRILPPGPVSLPMEDWCAVAPGAREERVRQAALAEALAPLDLARGPLYRARLLRLEEQEHVLLFTVHHIVADGGSMGLLMNELARLYEAHHRDAPPALPELPYQYADFAVWQRQRLSGEYLERLLTWWRAQLAELPTALELPSAREPGGEADARGGTLRVLLRPELATKLHEVCSRAGVTPFMWLLATFQTLLFRTTGQEDVPVGVADSGRHVAGSERLIGNFVNMLVLRTPLGGDPPFSELLRRVRRTALGAFSHQELPFELLARGRPPLFRAAFGTQNQPREHLTLPGLAVEQLHVDPGVSRLDLTLWASETPQGPQCVWTYATRLFDADAVTRLHQRFERLLEATLTRPETRLAALPLESPEKAPSKESLAGLGARSRRPVKLSRNELVSTRPALEGAAYPLLIEPRLEGLELVAWARESRAFLEEQLVKHGGVLLRGFRMEGVGAFAELIRATSGEPLPYLERSSPRELVEDRVYTSTSHPAEQEIFLHTEQSYNLTFPGRISFHCITPAEERGATPIACTRRPLRELPRELAERFLTRGYRYVRNFGGGLGLSWQTAFQTEDRSVVERYCRENHIELQWLGGDRLRTSQVRRCVARHPRTGEPVWFNHATFFHVSTLEPALVAHLRSMYREEEMPNNTFYGDGSPIEPEVLDVLRAAYQRAKVAVPWQRGDCLLLDNMLMAHGREPFRGERRVVVAMSEPRRWADVAFEGRL